MVESDVRMSVEEVREVEGGGELGWFKGGGATGWEGDEC